MSATLPQKYQVPSVESACRMLRLVCEADRPMSVAELTALSETSRTTAMRIASSLCGNGFLGRDNEGKLIPGEVMRVLGSRMQNKSDLRERAVPALHELARAVGETAHLAIPLETHCLLQEVVDSPQLVRVASRPGTLIDYHCSATGKSILAFRGDLLLVLRQSMELVPRTQNSITDWDAFDEELRLIRKRGYAIDEEEYHKGIRCVGAPITNSSGIVVAAIGTTGTTNRLTKRRIPSVAKLVVSTARNLSS